MVKRLLKWFAAGILVICVVTALLFAGDMRAAYRRVEGQSEVVASPYGDIEYKVGGSGQDVLVIHGSGGGFDQGELLAQGVVGDDFHWIAPSRFGYLQSTFNEGATFEEQAEAYAFLLDHLKIKKVAVVAISHGGPSALLFAAKYPERISSLTLLSAGVASSESADQAQANIQGKLLTTIYQHDALYWLLTSFFKHQFMELMGANREVARELTAEQRAMAENLIDYMNPVEPRSAGVVLDNTASLPNERITAITAPTLIFHAQDDTLQLYRNAEFAAQHIPGARLVSFEGGGHLVTFVEQEKIRSLLQGHLHSNF